MADSNAIPYFLAFNFGVISHLGFFKQGERFLYPLRYVQALFLAIFISTFAKSHYGEVSPIAAFQVVIRYTGVFLLGLYSSLITYRLFFNPLNKFPGPFMARLTKFDHVFRNGKMRNFIELHDLHQKHGKYVRIGPNDLSVTDPDGVQVVSSPNSTCTKSQWYQQDTPFISMHTTRDRGVHDRRRRVWAPAFSDKALRGYEGRVQKYNDLLIEQLTKSRGKPVDVANWFNLYSFDVMGDLGLGTSFNMLDTGERHWAIKLLGEGMDPLGFGFPPWLFRVLVAIPGLSAGYHKFIGFCSQQVDERMKRHGKSENTDIIHTLIEHYNDSKSKKDLLPMLQGDSRLIIVAGSDTTATTLVHIFYYLAKYPKVQKKLRDEFLLLPVNEKNQLDHLDLMKCDYLNGCIDEALRLNPPVPSGVFRKTPPEGVEIGKTFVPGNTVIQMPHYAMGHDEDNFADCEEFIPERYFSKPELIKHKDAWGPFSTGPFGCIGKNLAYMEIRMLVSQILLKFEVELAPGEDGSKLIQQSRDHFTMELKPLELVFTDRE